VSKSRSRKRRDFGEIVTLMDEFRQSGLSVAAFARRIGVSAPTVYNWKRQLAQRQHCTDSPPPVPQSMVRVIPSGAPAAALPVPITADAGISIILPGGLACRIEPHFDGETLRRLLRLLSN
jgi:Mn-dependent DtxR family transcriptional regulator